MTQFIYCSAAFEYLSLVLWGFTDTILILPVPPNMCSYVSSFVVYRMCLLSRHHGFQPVILFYNDQSFVAVYIYRVIVLEEHCLISADQKVI